MTGTAKRILINATQTEELRVAIVDITTQGLLDLLIERKSYITKTGNIYMGTITAIEPSLDACFVNFGSERHGFLPFKEINPQYYNPNLSKPNRPSVKDSLKVGQKIIVQVEKEERGNKGAALTSYISLAGSYLVLMPNNPRAGGISRRVEGGDRDELREVLSSLPIPEEMGLIVRTAGVGKATAELQWDLNALIKQWEAIQKAAVDRNPPFLIHQESDIVIRAIRDYLREEVTEIWVDDAKIFERIREHLEQIRPDFVHCLKLYTNTTPLFNRYRIEHQIEAAHEREVRLPSGGSIVIGHTEALVAIDINSGQATKGKDIEQTAFEINKEAARFIACQLRLRDIGGLIVIDFIDMPSMRHRREVESELRNALKLDKARTQVGTISPRFGLLEMSRQRLRHSLGEATRNICPKCDGSGSIRSVESISLSILRMVEEDAIRPGTSQIQVQLPVDLATFMINEKREHIAKIEKDQNIQILIIPNIRLESPHYHIKRLTQTETSGTGMVRSGPSYRLAEIEEPSAPYKRGGQSKLPEEKPAVKALFTEPSPSTTKKTAPNLVKRIISSLFGVANTENTTPAKKAEPAATQPVNMPDRNQRNQERAHPRHTPRNPSAQTRRPRNTPPVERKISSFPVNKNISSPPASPSTETHTPIENRHNTRSRRGERGGNMQKERMPATQIQMPAKKPEPLNPPPYMQPTLSDSDLETYYQESAAFANKKAASSPSYQKGPSDTAPAPVLSTPASATPKEEMQKPLSRNMQSSLPSSEAQISTAATEKPVHPDLVKKSAPSIQTASPSTNVAPKKVLPPVIQAPKDWTPHKIASAPAAATDASATVDARPSGPDIKRPARPSSNRTPDTNRRERPTTRKAAPLDDLSKTAITQPPVTEEALHPAHVQVVVTPPSAAPIFPVEGAAHEKPMPPKTPPEPATPPSSDMTSEHARPYPIKEEGYAPSKLSPAENHAGASKITETTADKTSRVEEEKSE
jgi:ribonuclease E